MHLHSKIDVIEMIIGHVINPVKVNSSSDLYQAQPITFRSMIEAKNYSSSPENIIQFTSCYKEDSSLIKEDFIQLPFINRSVLDFSDFQTPRKLPLIADILDPLKTMNNIDYVIYTNVDIAVMPFFYDYIINKIENGSDSLIINRRVISEAKAFPLMFGDIGKPHPGFDCFVFRKNLLEKFEFEKVCIGANWIGRVFIANLIVHSNKLEIIKDAHLTFHIGKGGAWVTNQYQDYDLHNKRIAYKIIKNFKSKISDKVKEQMLQELLNFMDNLGKSKTILERMKYKLSKILSRIIITLND